MTKDMPIVRYCLVNSWPETLAGTVPRAVFGSRKLLEELSKGKDKK
jgi:hypothetical protein